jgi:hypothetical protein
MSTDRDFYTSIIDIYVLIPIFFTQVSCSFNDNYFQWS